MRKIILLSLAAGATLMAGGAAFAQGPAASPAARTATARPAPGADITRAQVQERAAASFARMDANSDGKIDAADREVRQRTRFDRLDADKNGAISFSEYSARRERPQRAAGQNAEGQRGPAASADGAEARGHRFGRRGGRGGHGFMAAAKDGATQAQFVAAALERFDRADADRNGVLTQAERKAARPERGNRAPRPTPNPS